MLGILGKERRLWMETKINSFKELKDHFRPSTNGNSKETCPACGNRSRYPEHPLCQDCNKEYVLEAANLAVSGTLPPSRLQWARSRGDGTLLLLRKEYEEAKEEERELQKPYWEKAHMVLTQKLSSRIDTKVFNKAKGIEFGKMWNADPERVKLSKRVNGLYRAIASLEAFLNQP